MSARIIDGKQVAEALRARIAAQVATFPYKPGLRVVRVGEDPASVVYVRNKDRAAAACGFDSATIVLPEATSEADLLKVVRQLNADPAVDGILVQFPLPPHIRQDAVIDTIDPAKDVDGLHPINAGRLVSGAKGLVPCTPKGVMHLLAAANTALKGARAVVIGRSVLVGKPVAQLLLAADATVTMAHSRTRDLAAECRRAEVLVAAVGRAQLVRGDWVAEGATVIDVGINRSAEGKLVGDVAFAEAKERAGAITPVPGGVGPMTIACLLENTLLAALARRG
jgi:methylenetetrahydrofolate dehydrogenase (NADP+) / methenyltetrahydrofolate cyclohydrolase